MSNYTLKLPKLKSAAAGALITLGLLAIPAIANAQTATEPWTGAIAGDNINVGTNDMLTDIRRKLNGGDITDAVRLAERYVESIEQNSRSGKTTTYRYDAYNALCISLTAQKSYDKASEACNTAIKDSPNRWFAYNSRGSLNYRTGKFADAIKDYRLALENAPQVGDISSVLEHNIRLAEAKN